MASKFLILFLSSILLVQNVMGRPDDSGLVENSEEYKPPGLSVVLYAYEKFSSFSDNTVRKGIKLLEDVSAEITPLGNKDEQTVAMLEVYSKAITKMKEVLKQSELKDLKQKYDILIGFGEILDDASRNVNPTASDTLFENAFKKHGMDELTKDFKQGFEKFSAGLIEEIHKLLNDKNEELPHRQDIEDFLEEFEAGDGSEEKFTIFEKFFRTFG